MPISDLASRWFAIREPRTPVSRALLIAQFATQRKQVPLIYAVVIAETLSIIYVLPDTLSSLLRVGAPLGFACHLRREDSNYRPFRQRRFDVRLDGLDAAGLACRRRRRHQIPVE